MRNKYGAVPPERYHPTGERGRERATAGVDVDMPYTDDEAEFLAAIERYKREKRRPFPAWSEVLAVLKNLGYRKPDAGEGG